MKFSIDMVRLQVRVPKDDFTFFINNYFSCSPYVQDYESLKASDYRYNFIIHEVIKDENPFIETSINNNFWLGFCHNSEKLSEYKGKKHCLVIEYNPNKCDITVGLLNKILKAFYFSADMIQVRSVDVALDLDIPITNIFVDKLRKRYYCDITNGDGRTIYVGARGQDGRIKIYDKAAEQKIKDKAWTRWEISIKFDNVQLAQLLLGKFDFNFNVPDVFYFDDLDLNEFDVEMRCYLYSLLNGFVRLNEFENRHGERSLRQKIKRTLEGSASFKKIDNTYKDYIYNTIISYFTDFASDFMKVPERFLPFKDIEEPKAISLAPIVKGEQIELPF